VIDTKLLRAFTHGRNGGAPPEKGVEVVVHLALSLDVRETSGGYFEENRWRRLSPSIPGCGNGSGRRDSGSWGLGGAEAKV
jgi:hypothetical protein